MLDVAVRMDFLKQAGWDGARESLVGEDWSQRHVARLEKGGRTAILMQSLPEAQAQATMGHKAADYVKVDAYLRGLGLSAPEIYAADAPGGLLLVEDLGPANFHDLLADGRCDERQLYLAATDVLFHLYHESAAHLPDVPGYYQGYVHTGRRRVIDWYAPAFRELPNEPTLVDEYLEVWRGIESKLPPVPLRFQHIDFHPHNLIWLPQRAGVASVGLIDFQDAMRGPAPYDLTNLLLDARRLVPPEIQAACLARMKEKLPPAEREVFFAWYPVLACQFHCRVIGQAYRLALTANKTRLLSYVPVLQAHLGDDLRLPLLKPLADFFARHGIGFDWPVTLHPDAIRPLIAADAF